MNQNFDLNFGSGGYYVGYGVDDDLVVDGDDLMAVDEFENHYVAVGDVFEKCEVCWSDCQEWIRNDDNLYCVVMCDLKVRAV